jgi:hypothetical protein
LTAVSTTTGPDGEVLHLVASPPAALPTVTKRDIEQAWDAAQAGTAGIAAPPRGFRFARPEGAPIELILNDRDAAAWAVAVDGIADLSTPRGISLCLRLLGLVELMSRAGWIRPWFTLGRAGTEIAPALLHAVAQSPLNEAGGFDETALRALLPRQPAPRRPGDGH